MSFTTLTSGEVASSEPVTTTLFTKVKDNFDDHEDRIETLEASIEQFLPIIFRVGGSYFATTNVTRSTANSTLYLRGAIVIVDTAGSAGTLTVDIKKKRGVGAFTSVFTTLPSVAFGAGSNASSSNAVLDTGQIDVVAGDILRVDITTIQTDGQGFTVRVDWDRG